VKSICTFAVLLGLVLVGCQSDPQDRRADAVEATEAAFPQKSSSGAWNCYGELGPDKKGKLLSMGGSSDPSIDTVEFRYRGSRKLALTLTATGPISDKVFYKGHDAEAAGKTRPYTDADGNRWVHNHYKSVASWLMIETSANVNCAPA